MHRIILFLVAATFLLAGFLRAQSPNVLMIIVDDLRPELGIYGSNVHTPNMDWLGAEGVVFDRAYCNSAVCGASRSSFLTGIRPGRHRFVTYKTWAEKDAPGAVPLPALFKKAGYQTVSMGKVFHHRKDFADAWTDLQSIPTNGSWRDYLVPEHARMDADKEQRGPAFEIYEGEEKYLDEKIADSAIDTLRKAGRTGQPFFLAAGFVKPHLPFNAPKKYWDLYDPDQIALPSTYARSETFPPNAYHRSGELRHYGGVPGDEVLPEDYARQLIHGYYASTSYVDAQIGRVLDELDRLGLRENTIVLLFSDHGYNLGEHTLWCKHCNFDHAMRVPLIIDAPGMTQNARTDALVELIDLYPTLVQLAGLQAPEDQLEGMSLVPILEDPETEVKPFVISKYQEGISLRTDRYLYTEWQDSATREIEGRMLFDLNDDPEETRNLAIEPDQSTLMDELQATLHANWGEDFERRPERQ